MCMRYMPKESLEIPVISLHDLFAPMQVTTEQLLDNPETIQQPDEEDEGDKQEESESPDDDLFNNNVNGNTNTGGYDFDEDFYR